jgi:outer membrane protein OmpA-like peptidoglycan-associated protein
MMRAAVFALVVSVTLGASTADAQEIGRFAVRGELGLAGTLSDFQRDALGYGVGVAGALRASVRLAGPLWIQVGAGHWLLPAAQGLGYVTPIDAGPRLAFEVGPSGRLWVDVNAGLAITGGDPRFGLSAGLGYSFRLGRNFDIGPMVRYQLVMASSSDLPADAHLGMIGLSLGFQPTPAPRVDAPPPPPPPLPPRPRDADDDGVFDEDDRCVREPAGTRPDPAQPGCPTRDSDGDRILDPDDRCVREPAGPTPDPTRAGCPDPDDDGDGVRNSVDLCPQQSQGALGDPARPGCPVSDRDGDAVPDASDACPDRPGAPSENPRRNGCPGGLVVVNNGLIRINRPVFFATNADVILPRSNAVLTAVAETLRLALQIRAVRVEGHTDNQGNPDANLDLSRRRAESVLRWLTAHGVDGARLAAAGLGQTRPVRTNLTRGGRAANRRVEFHIVNPNAR